MKLATLDVLMPLLPLTERGCCALCSQERARWTIRGAQPPVYLCALCLLYATPWGGDNSSQIETTLALSEYHSRRTFERVDGRLVSCSDADNLMGILILVDRTAKRMPG